MRAAHGTEVRGLRAFLRQSFIMEFSGRHRIKREVKLVFPPEFKPRFGEGIVAILRAGKSFRQVRRVRRNFVGITPSLTSFLLGNPKCSFGVT